MLILSMLFAPFLPRRPENTILVGQSKTRSFLLSAPGKNRGGSRASLVERVRTAWVGLSSPGVLRLRAPSALLCDKSVRRFAQDDDFVAVLKKSMP